jgi:phosphatidyl-myo-inositol alpha-mannosyltransferase
MRIGMVCPYSFDVPGGVQAHVLQLAEVMRNYGHEVSVLAPSSPHVDLPDYVVSGGKAVPIPYNGSVARLRFGPATHRKVKKWLRDGDFDVLHIHEPNAPSLSMLALMVAEGPIVATFHTSTTKSLTLSVFQGILRPWHEKIVGRIAVSDLARRWQMEALGSDAVQIPNGVDVGAFASAPKLDGYPRPGRSVLFLGRYDEPRKGMNVLLRALPELVEAFPEVEVLIVGRGDEDELREQAGELAKHLTCLGAVGVAQRGRRLRTQHRRRELRHRARRGHGGRHRGGGQRPGRLPPGARGRNRGQAGPGRRRVGTGVRADRGAVGRCRPAPLRRGGEQGGAPLRLVGGGTRNLARLRDRGWGGGQGSGGRLGGQQAPPACRRGRSSPGR